MGIYDCTAGRFSAVAAALRRRLHDSSHGEVPMVKPCELETTLWKVWKVGRDTRADWSLIQSCRTESKELAKIMRYFISIDLYNRTTALESTLLPMRTWKTGPYCLAHFPATVACLFPSCSRFPKIGTPGISGMPLILGMSVRLKYRMTKYTAVTTAMASVVTVILGLI